MNTYNPQTPPIGLLQGNEGPRRSVRNQASSEKSTSATSSTVTGKCAKSHAKKKTASLKPRSSSQPISSKNPCQAKPLPNAALFSSSEEDDDFTGFSNDKTLVCYECGDSVHTNETTFAEVQQVALLGMRWHCPSCLKCPANAKSLKQDFEDFKLTMLKDLADIKNYFNAKIECLQSSASSELGNKIKQPLQRPNTNAQTVNKTTHQVIVSTDTPFTPVTFADKVKKNLSKVPIQKIAVNKNGQGIINFPDQVSRDSGLNLLKDDFKVVSNNRPQRTLLPKITIQDVVSADYSNTDTLKLKKSICDKNPAINELIEKGKEFEILFIKEDLRKANVSIAVAKVDIEILKIIQFMKYQIYVDFSRCRVSDRFHVTQCYKCQKFGHVKSACTSQNEVCRYCSGNHDGKNCPHNGNKAMYKCANCEQNHSTTYAGCSVLQNQVMSLAHRTQGMDKFSKNQIRRNVIVT